MNQNNNAHICIKKYTALVDDILELMLSFTSPGNNIYLLEAPKLNAAEGKKSADVRLNAVLNSDKKIDISLNILHDIKNNKCKITALGEKDTIEYCYAKLLSRDLIKSAGLFGINAETDISFAASGRNIKEEIEDICLLPKDIQLCIFDQLKCGDILKIEPRDTPSYYVNARMVSCIMFLGDIQKHFKFKIAVKNQYDIRKLNKEDFKDPNIADIFISFTGQTEIDLRKNIKNKELLDYLIERAAEILSRIKE